MARFRGLEYILKGCYYKEMEKEYTAVLCENNDAICFEGNITKDVIEGQYALIFYSGKTNGRSFRPNGLFDALDEKYRIPFKAESSNLDEFFTNEMLPKLRSLGKCKNIDTTNFASASIDNKQVQKGQ